jgi:hypothetical protein
MNVPQNQSLQAEGAVHGAENSARGFMEFNEGDLYDGIGRKVVELIMKTDSFIVFLDEFGSIQWGYSHIKVTSNNYNVVVNRVADLETRSRFLWLDKSAAAGTDIQTHQHALFSARRLLAEAVARILDTNSLEAAQGILDTAEKWIAQRSLDCSRRWLLIPFSVLATMGLIAFFFLVFLWGGLPDSGTPQLWVLGTLLGGVGALVSNVIFNRKIPFDATAGKNLHQLEAVIRWLVGAVAGLTTQLLIEGDVVFGFLGSGVGVLVLSLLAGLSELFFPTLLNRFDKSVEATGQLPSDTQPPAVSPTVPRPLPPSLVDEDRSGDSSDLGPAGLAGMEMGSHPAPSNSPAAEVPKDPLTR